MQIHPKINHSDIGYHNKGRAVTKNNEGQHNLLGLQCGIHIHILSTVKQLRKRFLQWRHVIRADDNSLVNIGPSYIQTNRS